jgi:hypothetical protein
MGRRRDVETRVWAAGCVAVLLAGGMVGREQVSAAGGHGLAGRWALNRALSQIPRDVGFNLVTVPSTAAGAPPSENASLASALYRESEAEGRRREQLVDEVRNPPGRLTIAETADAVTLTNAQGRSRTFHPNGREEMLQLAEDLPVPTTARWDADRLEIRYRVAQRRELRYTLSRAPDSPRLTVRVQFIEQRPGDSVTLVYEPAPAEEPPPAPAPLRLPALTPPAPSGAAGTPPAPQAPAQALAPPIARGPDAALKDLRRLGVVVEDFSSQETACGLKQPALDTAVSKVLTDAGLQVIRNTDEDTYLYVHIMSATASNGLCVSRYDVYLYTHTMATLSYQSAPVLAQVELFHKGGMSGGAPAAHAESVSRGVKQYVEEIADRIRAVNR